MKNSNTGNKVRTLKVMTAILIVIFSSFNAFAQQQIKSYNYLCNNISSNENTRAIINRVDTGYAISGYTYHPVCGISPFDWMWLQLKSNGNVNASRYIGTIGDDKCYSLIQDPTDRSYTLAGFMYDATKGRSKATIVDLNGAGNFNYAKWASDTLNSAYWQVVIDPSRYLGLTGYMERVVSNKLRNKLFCSQYTPAGPLAWSYRYDSWNGTVLSASIEEGRSICFQPVGGVYGVAVRTNFYSKSTTAWDPMIVKLDYAGNVIWKKVYRFNVTNPNYYPSAEPTKIIPMPDGGFTVVGFTNSILQNGGHILVFRVASNGTLMWSSSYGTTVMFHYGNSIVLDGNNLTITGYRRSASGQDALIMKIPVTGGAPLWTRVWNPQANSEAGFDIILSNQSTTSTGYAVTGDVNTNSGDAFLWRTNNNGLLDSSACNNSTTLTRIANDIRLDSFNLTKVTKYDKNHQPIVRTTAYTETLICLGTYATLPDEEINNDNIGTEEVTEYSISQNYPNPFNPSTTIRFSVPQEGNVAIKVYDIAGKLVAELVNGYMQRGNHSVQFNAANLPTGAYYYRIDANGFTDIKKMLLIK